MYYRQFMGTNELQTIYGNKCTKDNLWEQMYYRQFMGTNVLQTIYGNKCTIDN